MTRNLKKLKWERLGSSFDLTCLNSDQLDKKVAKKLLQKIEVIYDDFKKPFDKNASILFQQWLKNTTGPLPEAFYCLLSNWFLAKNAASISIRAGLALILWRKLFCAIPDSKLTNWRISERKVIPEKFNQWWQNQVECQEDC